MGRLWLWIEGKSCKTWKRSTTTRRDTFKTNRRKVPTCQYQRTAMRDVIDYLTRGRYWDNRSAIWASGLAAQLHQCPEVLAPG
jgi:hypothetical protein